MFLQSGPRKIAIMREAYSNLSFPKIPSVFVIDLFKSRPVHRSTNCRRSRTGVGERHGQTVADRRAPTCAEPAAGTADWIIRAIERAAAAMPTSLAERLNAIQDRIWAMHDALLTIRLPSGRDALDRLRQGTA
jgi:hypothetical protein